MRYVFTATWAETKSESSTETPSSALALSPTCEWISRIVRVGPRVPSSFLYTSAALFAGISARTPWLPSPPRDWARSASWSCRATRRWEMCCLRGTCQNSGGEALVWSAVSRCYLHRCGKKAGGSVALGGLVAGVCQLPLQPKCPGWPSQKKEKVVMIFSKRPLFKFEF